VTLTEDHVSGATPPVVAGSQYSCSQKRQSGSDVVVTQQRIGGDAGCLSGGLVGRRGVEVARTVKLVVPVDVDVPEMAPVTCVQRQTGSNDPALTDQVYGVVPPEALSVVL